MAWITNVETNGLRALQEATVDLEAVNRIKAAIKKGEYPINLDVVAEELMNSYIEMKS